MARMVRGTHSRISKIVLLLCFCLYLSGIILTGGCATVPKGPPDPVTDHYRSKNPDSRVLALNVISYRNNRPQIEEYIRLYVKKYNISDGEAYRDNMLRSLDNLSNETALQMILTAMEKDKYPKVRMAAVRGLANYPEEFQSLLDALDDEDAGVRETAIRILWKLKQMRKLNNDQLAQPVIDALADEDSRVREATAELVIDFEDKKAVPLLKDLLGDPSPSIRKKTLIALEKVDPENAEKQYIEHLNDPDPAVRLTAVWRLGIVGGPEAFEPLAQMLSDDKPRIAEQAADSLGILGAEDVLPDLAMALERTDLGSRWMIFQAISRIGGEEALPIVVKMLEKGDPADKVQAIKTLETLKDPRAVLPLSLVLEQNIVMLWGDAARALGQIGDSAAAWPLESFLSRSRALGGPAVTAAKVEAVKAMGLLKSKTSLPVLENLLEDPGVNTQAISAICEIGGVNILGILKRMEKSSYKEVSRRAKRCLGKFPSEVVQAYESVNTKAALHSVTDKVVTSPPLKEESVATTPAGDNVTAAVPGARKLTEVQKTLTEKEVEKNQRNKIVMLPETVNETKPAIPRKPEEKNEKPAYGKGCPDLPLDDWSVSVMKLLLEHPDREVRIFTIKLLNSSGRRSSGRKFLQELTDHCSAGMEEDDKRLLAERLRMEDTIIVPFSRYELVEAALEKETDQQVHEFASTVIRKRKELLEASLAGRGPKRSSGTGSAGSDSANMEQLLKTLKAAPDLKLKVKSAWAMIKLDRQKGADQVRLLLNDKNRLTTLASALVLAPIEDEEGFARLVHFLKSGSGEEKNIAASRLGAMRNSKSVEPLIDVLNDPEVQSRAFGGLTVTTGHTEFWYDQQAWRSWWAANKTEFEQKQEFVERWGLGHRKGRIWGVLP